jgi:hypothetical protein
LYSENCAGCHGAEGRGGAAIALASPVYLSITDDATIRKVIARGVRGTAMPVFGVSAGGMLTDKQIEVITTQVRSGLRFWRFCLRRFHSPRATDFQSTRWTEKNNSSFSLLKLDPRELDLRASVHLGRLAFII